ncbi:hypothetical protein BX070DRAFT_192978, partial [Coemansia spiralis]
LEEISSTIKHSARNKAPGSDGLSYEFYRRYVDTVTPKLLALYNSYWERGDTPHGWKETHTVLLPIKGNHRSLAN